jgi:hypothetical protein
MGRLLQEFFEKISFFRHFQQCSAKFTPDSGRTASRVAGEATPGQTAMARLVCFRVRPKMDSGGP